MSRHIVRKASTRGASAARGMAARCNLMVFVVVNLSEHQMIGAKSPSSSPISAGACSAKRLFPKPWRFCSSIFAHSFASGPSASLHGSPLPSSNRRFVPRDAFAGRLQQLHGHRCTSTSRSDQLWCCRSSVMTNMGIDLVEHITPLPWKLRMPPAGRLRVACAPDSARFPRLGHSPDRGLIAAHLCALCAAPVRRICR